MKLEKMKRREKDLFDQLNNLEILEEDYGIKIPDNELNMLMANFDEDLLEQYQKEKAAKKFLQWKWLTKINHEYNNNSFEYK